MLLPPMRINDDLLVYNIQTNVNYMPHGAIHNCHHSAQLTSFNINLLYKSVFLLGFQYFSSEMISTVKLVSVSRYFTCRK